VGTANIGGTAVGMNVLAMLRQPNGESADLVNTPRLSGPFAFTVGGVTTPDGTYDANLIGQSLAAIATIDQGPSVAEVGGAFIGGSQQVVASNLTASTPTSFGITGGLFGNGFAPANYTSSGIPSSFNPYQEPLYAGSPGEVYSGSTLVQLLGTTATVTPWGGPPAFDPQKNGTGTLGSGGTSIYCETLSSGACTKFPGIPLGYNVFQGVTPGTGQYTLAANVPTGVTGSTSVTATDASTPVLLPTIATPTVVFTEDAKSGADATLSYVLPAGVVGAYVEVSDLGPADTDPITASSPATFLGPCYGGGGIAYPTFYTFWVTASGTSTITSAYGANAPNGPAICDAAYYAANKITSPVDGNPLPSDTLQVAIIGFDYNEYALQYSSGTTQVQKPAIPATADVTMSAIGFFPNPGPAYLMSKSRQAAGVKNRR
jgi:hypothetical protein